MFNSFETPWTVARQVFLSTEFHRQECWSGLPFPSPGDLPNPGIKPGSAVLQADSLCLIHQVPPCVWNHSPLNWYIPAFLNVKESTPICNINCKYFYFVSDFWLSLQWFLPCGSFKFLLRICQSFIQWLLVFVSY